MKIHLTRLAGLLLVSVPSIHSQGQAMESDHSLSYPVVDTAQELCYDDAVSIPYPARFEAYYGQDAQYKGHLPDYTVNDNGTVRDNVTGLMWTHGSSEKLTYKKAKAGASKCKIGGYTDWRLPTIKELYSLIQFNGIDPDPQAAANGGLKPFIDDQAFEFHYGDSSQGERIIDAQYVSSTECIDPTMGDQATVFGVNFADGRIKGYGLRDPRGEKNFAVLYVRENPKYGKNDFVDNGDGTITDQATGLTWMKTDSHEGMDWPTALDYAENLNYAGYTDWRLPNAKELQSIVDYNRSPSSTNSPALDPIFEATEILNEAGEIDYANYWTSTSHSGLNRATAAVYVAFGRSLGFMRDRRTQTVRLLDVHGAGSQRSDPKVGDAAEYPQGRGPQGDVIRIENFVRCVRGGAVSNIDTSREVAELTPR